MKKKIIMKELSIEEKAKAYDKAIERAKGEYAKFEGMLPGDVLEEVFPELKESNDERTRKWLIEMVEEVRKANPSNADHNGNCSEAIAWLEKQGEQKPVECCADKLWTEFKKQVAYLMASSYNREYEYTKGYVEWVAQSLLGYAKNEIEQKPAEWSDDDEAFLDDILCKVESNLLLNKDEKNWLKSIKERYTWKPSDEQMEFLQKYAEQNNYDGSILTSLYQDLRKRKK